MPDARPPDPGVQLPRDRTASALLHSLLLSAAEEFEELGAVPIPTDANEFRSSFEEVLPRFEVARVASPRRSAIARHIAIEAGSALVYRQPDGSDIDLKEFLQERREPLAVATITGTARAGLRPCIPFDDRTHEIGEFEALLDALQDRHEATPPAVAGLRWAAERLPDGLDLRGHKFAIMGAGAELAPTRLLLSAGADVLWLDIAPPALDPSTFAGALHHCPGGADLLTQPGEIVSTIEQFADGTPVNLGLFAYAAGRGREWRLEASMNAVVRAVSRRVVRSMSVYISPTSPVAAHPEDLEAARQREGSLPLWQRAFRGMGALRPGYAEHAGHAVARSIIPIQGASYQAAQYVAKTLAAEAFALAPDATRRIPRVSANVAGITNTSSMSAAVFQAAFLAAPRFRIHIFRTEATRWLSGLLMLHDLLADGAALEDDRPEQLSERQIHGGVNSNPHAFRGTVTVAGFMGLARKPSYVRGFFGR